MLTRRHIEQLNAPKKDARSPVPRVVGGSALLAALLFAVGLLVLDSLPIGAGLAAVVLLGGGAFALRHARQNARPRPLEFQYGLMDPATQARLSRINRAFGVLVGASSVWRVERREDGSTENRPVEIRVEDPPDIRTDVDVWVIIAGGCRVFFLPEAVLVYEEGHYRALSYQTFRVELSTERVIEEGEVPEDVEVVGRSWRYIAEDGLSRDRTKAFNPELPQVLYGVLRLRAGSWRGPVLWVSSESAAAQFVLAFLEGNPNPERIERWQGVRPYEDRGKGDPAYAALGLEDGAPKREVTAAYRRIARAYHPDRTARFVPEFRALADRRMQEINAAYSRLRREAT